MKEALFTPKRYLICIILLVGTGGILYGFDVGVISGALLLMQKTIALSNVALEVIVGSVFGGSLVGTLIAGPLADKIGRRLVVTVAALTFVIGIFCVISAKAFLLLLIGRLLLGIGIGIVSVAVPLYALELAPTQHRGLCVSVFQLFLSSGIVLAFFIDMLLIKSGNWHAMFEVVLVPAVILLIGILFLPESPRWLLINAKKDEAIAVLSRLHSSVEVKTEVEQLERSLKSNEGTWRDLFSKRLMIPLIVSVTIAILQQLTGINVILQYAPVMLKSAGFSSNYISMLGSVGIGLMNLIFTIVGMFLIDKVGRRPLLLVGVAGIVVSEVLLGFFQFLPMPLQIKAVLSILGLLLFITSYAVGPGVAIWLVMSELFPTHVRGKGLALCLFFNSLASTVASSLFYTLTDAITLGGVFWLAAFFSLCYFLTVKFGFVETSARSLEEIQEGFTSQEKARREKLCNMNTMK